MRGGVPTRSSERIYAESYLDYRNNIFIFIEDNNENTRKIMLELIQRSISSDIPIDRLHSLGGRDKVIESFENKNDERNEIYIVDGDLNLCFENITFIKGLVVLNRYAIENYLLDGNAIFELLYEEATLKNDKDKLYDEFGYEDWFSEQNILLIELFKIYAIEKKNELGLETIHFSVSKLRCRDNNNILCKLDNTLIQDRIKSLVTLIKDRIGEEQFLEDKEYINNKTYNKNSEELASAKDYILPLIFDRFKKVSGNTNFKYDSIKYRLSKICNIEPFKENLVPHIEAN